MITPNRYATVYLYLEFARTRQLIPPGRLQTDSRVNTVGIYYTGIVSGITARTARAHERPRGGPRKPSVDLDGVHLPTGHSQLLYYF